MNKYEQIDRILEMIAYTKEVKFTVSDRNIIVTEP